jgi:beta-galactosidase
MKNKIISFFLFFSFILSVSGGFPRNIAKIKQVNGVPFFCINDSIYPPLAYMSYISEEQNYESFVKTNTHVYCFPAHLGDQGINVESGIGLFRTPIWLDYDKYDFSSLREDFEKIIKADLQAKIIIRLYLDPPQWWVRANPEHACHTVGGEKFRQCFASGKWKEETGKAMKDCIAWLKESPYSEYTVGIHVAAGATEEWYCHRPHRNDQNPLRLSVFREWLFQKYNGRAADLRKAWKDDAVTFATAMPVAMDKQPEEKWLIPSEEQQTMDSFRFHAELLADAITYFCKVVKDATDREWLTGVFYGYHIGITDPRFGHGAFKKVVECEDLDFMSSPNTYNRVIGEDWLPMLAVQSVLLHGKMWLAENDTRTCLTTLLKEKAPHIPPEGQYNSGVWIGPEDMQTSLSFLWKNAGRMLTSGYGGWWFDMWGGWYNCPEMENLFRLTVKFFEYPPVHSSKTEPEICIIQDEQLCFMDAGFGAMTGHVLSNIYTLARTGTAYNHYVRTDLFTIPPEQYKVVWLMGFLELSEKEQDLIRKLRAENRTIIVTEAGGTRIYHKEKDVFIKDFVSFTDSQLRSVFKEAGAHIYDYSGDVFYLGRNWLCSHTVFGGEKTFYLPFEAKVINPVTDEVLYNATRIIKYNAEEKSTTVLRIIPL